MILLLELIWTRLTYGKQIPPSTLGFDLNIEILRPLLLAKALERNGQVGWYYEYFVLPQAILDRIPPVANWQPIELDEGQDIVLAYLIMKENSGVTGGVDADSSELEEFRDSVEFLHRVGLISLEEDGKLRLLTRECGIATLPDGRMVAGENIDGRLSSWLENYNEDLKK